MMLLPEERLRRLEGTNVLLLRPVSFFENFYDALGLIKHQGINGRPATSPTSRRRRSRPATGRASLCASCSARATSPIPRRRAS